MVSGSETSAWLGIMKHIIYIAIATLITVYAKEQLIECSHSLDEAYFSWLYQTICELTSVNDSNYWHSPFTEKASLHFYFYLKKLKDEIWKYQQEIDCWGIIMIIFRYGKPL